MCNLYNLTTNQQAIRDVVWVAHDSIGNLEPGLDLYPDRPARVVRNTDSGRELARLTCGMPMPPQFLRAPDAPDTGVPNIHNLSARTGGAGWTLRDGSFGQQRAFSSHASQFALPTR